MLLGKNWNLWVPQDKNKDYRLMGLGNLTKKYLGVENSTDTMFNKKKLFKVFSYENV